MPALQIPKRKLTIFAGVSSSGKSSIVFAVWATQTRRQLYENFSLFIRNFLPKYPQPDAGAIETSPWRGSSTRSDSAADRIPPSAGGVIAY